MKSSGSRKLTDNTCFSNEVPNLYPENKIMIVMRSLFPTCLSNCILFLQPYSVSVNRAKLRRICPLNVETHLP